jgi:hypothetical protein
MFGNRRGGGGDAVVAHLHRDRTELEAARVDAEAARLNGEEAEAERGGEAEDEDEGGGLYIGAEAAANGAEAGGGGALCGVRRRLLRPPPPTVLDEGDGAYTVGYGSCVAGRLLLHLSLGTRPLCPPIGLRVLPAEACAQHSLALPTALGQRGADDAGWAAEREEWEGWEGAAGRPATVGVRLSDAYGNACEVSCQSCQGVALQLRGPEMIEGSVHLAPPYHCPPPPDGDGADAAAACAGDGAEEGAAGDDGGLVLSAVATPRLCGRYYAHVTLRGVELMGSPRPLRVHAAAAVAACCDVFCEGLSGAVVAGTPCGFRVQARRRPLALLLQPPPANMSCKRRRHAAPCTQAAGPC